MFNVSILTIGDEICIGQVVNNNASWIAAQCTQLGAKVHMHSTIGDEKDAMKLEIARLLKSSDFVITTGGLGPTHDDITKLVLADYFGDELAFHEATLNYLTENYKKRGIAMLERNRQMALIPKSARVLPNRIGSAPGLLFEQDGKFLVALPGVPAEMRYIMTDSVLPMIQELMIEKKSDILLYKTIQTANIAESVLAERLGEPDEFLGKGNTLAFLPSYRGLRLRIGVASQDFESAQIELSRIEKHIRDKAEKYIFAVGDETITGKIAQLMLEKNKTISVAESCTGGMLGGELTAIAGSSSYFSGGAIVYSNEAKINILDVNPETIEKHGAVSSETACELAKNVRVKFNTDFGISITGIAGPGGGTSEKPVGTTYIGLADAESVYAEKFVFTDDRIINREIAVGRALGMIYQKLTEQK